MGTIKKIVLHNSDSSWGNVNVIREWHIQKSWKDIGYQFVILNGRIGPHTYFESLDGSIECGRNIDADNVLNGEEVGAHALGLNNESVGICLIGLKSFTPKQFEKLKSLLVELCKMWGLAPKDVVGHYETETGKAQRKTCPNFNVEDLRVYLKGRI